MGEALWWKIVASGWYFRYHRLRAFAIECSFISRRLPVVDSHCVHCYLGLYGEHCYHLLSRTFRCPRFSPTNLGVFKIWSEFNLILYFQYSIFRIFFPVGLMKWRSSLLGQWKNLKNSPEKFPEFYIAIKAACESLYTMQLLLAFSFYCTRFLQ